MATKQHSRVNLDDGAVLYIDCGGDYTTVGHNSQNCILQRIIVIICNITQYHKHAHIIKNFEIQS